MTNLKNKERVIRALDDDLLKPLARYVETEFGLQAPGKTPASYFNGRDKKPRREFEKPMPEWDVRMHLRFILVSWRYLDWKLDRSLIEEVLNWANRSHHDKGDLSDEEAKKALRSLNHLWRVVAPKPGPKVQGIFEKYLADEHEEVDWPDGDYRFWPSDLNSRWPGRPEGSVGFIGSSGTWTPDGTYVGRGGGYEGVWLEVLPLDRPSREGSGSLAMGMAAKAIEAIRYPNSVVFLAVDGGAVPSVRESICEHRAWERTEKEIWKTRDDFMTHEREGAESCMEECRRIGAERMRLGYRWLLIPALSKSGSSLRWSAVQLEASPDLIHYAWRQLESAGAVATHLEPTRLAGVLEQVPLWAASSHVLISKMALEFSRHLHLPRLKNWNVLYAAIAESLGTPDCPFAFGLCSACLAGVEQGHDFTVTEKPSASLLRAGCLVRRHGQAADPR